MVGTDLSGTLVLQVVRCMGNSFRGHCAPGVEFFGGTEVPVST